MEVARKLKEGLDSEGLNSIKKNSGVV